MPREELTSVDLWIHCLFSSHTMQAECPKCGIIMCSMLPTLHEMSNCGTDIKAMHNQMAVVHKMAILQQVAMKKEQLSRIE